MNKDNLLFTIIGLLIGFLAGYMLQEALAARQPARRVAGEVVGAPQEAAAPGMPAAGGAPEMEAIQRLRERVDANPKDAEAVLELANANFQIGRWDRARDLYTQYLGLRPANPDVLSDLGVTHRELGQFDRALELFRQAQRMDSDHWQSVYNEVVVLGFNLEQYDTAEEAMTRLRKMQPGNPDVERLAEALDQRKRASQAS